MLKQESAPTLTSLRDSATDNVGKASSLAESQKIYYKKAKIQTNICINIHILYAILFHVEFEWDSKKNQDNLEKHDVDFYTAKLDFLD
ncbi:hypothetical protein LPTSP3_g31320 [Leptospira kobayashii]|uniref:Uncharacterized protein n=1 Tax=Leptospira kobayashii TaxID=1917830 RepID=A0ABN6KLP2_9LEPT|nr:hypothetical protein LPTSP3_g31320 [Leptospira kobayashii]